MERAAARLPGGRAGRDAMKMEVDDRDGRARSPATSMPDAARGANRLREGHLRPVERVAGTPFRGQ